MKLALASFCLLLCACSQPTGVKVILGAQLNDIPYSVVVIDNGKITAVGPQSQIPVPKGSEITRGIGKILEPIPTSSKIAPGESADLLLRDPSNGSQMTMRSGEWVK